MKRLATLLILLVSASLANAQQPDTLRVAVVDSYDAAPLDGATVELVEDQQVVGTATTSSDGVASFLVIITSREVPQSHALRLGTPYPNPFDQTASVPLALKQPGEVTMVVYDLLGRQVATAQRYAPAGVHTLSVDLSGLSSGQYFLRVTQDGGAVGTASLAHTGRTGGTPSLDLQMGVGVFREPPASKGASANQFEVRITKEGYEGQSYAVKMPEQRQFTAQLTLTPTVTEETVVVDPQSVSVREVLADSLVFTMQGGAPNINVGDVVVSGEGYGFLRRVTGVDVQGNTVTLVTEQATLAEVLENASFGKQYTPSTDQGKAGSWQAAYLAEGVTITEGGIGLNNVVLWEGDYGGATAKVYIPEGAIEFGPELDIGFKIRFGGIKEFHATAGGEFNFYADIVAETSGAFDLSGEVEIAELKVVLLQIIGVVPIVEVVTLSYVAGFEGYASHEGTAQAGLDVSAGITFGAVYEDGAWGLVNDRWLDATMRPVTWQQNTEVRVRGYVRPRLDVKFYGVAGPYLYVEPYLRFALDARSADWTWALSAGVDVGAGVDASALGFDLGDFPLALAQFEEEIATGSGTSSGEAPDAPSSPSPSDGATSVGSSPTLRWTASDPNGDALTYDVYFGTNVNPTLVAQDVADATYSPGALVQSTTYYWQVVAKDGFNETQGPVWSFTTGTGASLEEITNSIDMKLIRIPAGTFQMGDMAGVGGSDERPVHEVTITRDFYLGKYEVTQAEYVAVVGSNPSRFTGDDTRPVEQVLWYEATHFANALSQSEGLEACYDGSGNVIGGGGDVYACGGYRLPTESEWEYATRAGTTTLFSFGDSEAELGNYAWYSSNSGSQTHPVGQKQSNPWGLYDVHGNVWEWVHDWYSSSYYSSSPSSDPAGAASGSFRVIRGGGWNNRAIDLRSASRGWSAPGDRSYGIGFRLLRAAQ